MDALNGRICGRANGVYAKPKEYCPRFACYRAPAAVTLGNLRVLFDYNNRYSTSFDLGLSSSILSAFIDFQFFLFTTSSECGAYCL